MKKSLKYQLFKAVGVDQEKQEVKMTEAPIIKAKEKGKFAVPKFGVLQADLIYMRDDKNGYKYILTVVDVATRKMDAIPLKGREAWDVIEGFEKVWSNKYLDREKVDSIYTDSGTEFKNKDFKEYMEGFGIDVFTTMTARHQQTGIVEYTNHVITKTLGTKMTSEELVKGEHFNDWANLLPEIVKVLNGSEDWIKIPKIQDFFKEPKTTSKELDERLEVGTVVHVRLQQPINHMVTDKKDRLHGGFRNGDTRWEKDLTEVVNVAILPNQPIRYLVKKYNNVSFIRKELLLASPEETAEYKKNNPEKVEPKRPEKYGMGARTRSQMKI